MTSESHRTSFFLRNQRNLRLNIFLYYLCSSVKSAKSVANSLLSVSSSSLKPGLSLVELLIAIGILGVTMMLIGAAFPAGVAMSVAVSDETTSQAVFQKALAEIKANLKISGNGSTLTTNLAPFVFSDDSRKLSTNSSFSWTAMVRRMATSGPMGNLCQVVVIVSRRPGGSPKFINDSDLPELKSVSCDDSDDTARTLTIASSDFNVVPNDGYIIDETTGTAYIIVSRDKDTDKIVTLSTPPKGASGNFWVVPGPQSGGKYSLKSPSIRVFQAMLYLP